jgi:hypothetical protein
MNTNGKLGPKATWLFALATFAVVIAVTYLLPHITGPLSPKAWGGVYFALFGAGAMAAAFMTNASALGTIGAFAVASVGLGIFYYIVVARAVAAAASELGGGGAALGTMTGMIFAIAFLLDALSAGIAGTLFGRKLRG